ncbi:D-2-hydroxyacid dehydrogenase [Parasphingopyxis marina]|uniref:D-2-hydroxyacid dehydrogenase n=1 Tax=Parasphingopyxis marina TaxID=2761622 RepID=A0A842I075_9SPHN|nr:D-2-hydroxyacid dehydrogenase [Parasphingopyxis marina]MBC2778039.1 D-2-hydroxyacid dehydrogenase [Parasphingopyxis marina]
MTTPIKAALSGLVRPLIEDKIQGLDVHWWMSPEEAVEAAKDAEIGWFDMYDKDAMATAIRAGEGLKWLNTIYAGLDHLPLDTVVERGMALTNGVGINAIPVAEYAVAGMLLLAKRLDEIVRAHDRHEWPGDSPGKAELYGSKVLIIGYGAIGQRIAQMLSGFEAEVTAVRRSPDESPNVLGPDEWQSRLSEFDWVVIAAPATGETRHLIGAEELAAMKPTANLVNIARGSLIDQGALRDALEKRSIMGAFLDPTDPEPLPADDPLWDAPNCLITMHMSGRSQTLMFQRGVRRFLDNLERYKAGEPLIGVADPALGY